jgi:hypothetical protein
VAGWKEGELVTKVVILALDLVDCWKNRYGAPTEERVNAPAEADVG